MNRYLLPIALLSAAASADDDVLSEVTVEAKRVANTEPASTYASVVTALRYDPLTELQSRGLPEGQADVTVRGGLFENTGFQIGAVTVTDPQTGHYAAEIPIDPAALTPPDILQDVANAQSGFNSSIATVHYDFTPMTSDQSINLGVGTDSLNFQSLRLATVSTATDGSASGIAISAARSQGDGTVENGDHEFQRFNLQWQHRSESAQTDVLIARQDKFYGWPGAYTGFATLPETDDTETSLFLANHRRDTDRGWFEVGAYLRNLKDDYDFNRTTTESGTPGSFDHRTRSMGVGFQGMSRTGAIAWRYGGQFAADELLESTDLTNGDFASRRYLKLSLVPTLTVTLPDQRRLEWQAGLTFDGSDRDSDVVNPQFGVRLAGLESTWELQYSEASQVPGYIVLQSGSTGLFGGNKDLGREESRQLTASLTHRLRESDVFVAIFSREDDGLVDWTFASSAPFSRQANPVDIDVLGLEAVYSRSVGSLDYSVGLTLLDKSPDYGTAAVDASFYALNYAEQRLVLALTWAPTDSITVRMDNEFRNQAENALRASSDSAYLGSLSVEWRAPKNGLSFQLTADNLTDDDFQFFPGTPGVGRQVSVSARYNW